MDKIFVENIRVLGKHGVYPRERSVEQEFLITVEMDVDTTKARMSDDVNDTVSYSDAKKIVLEIVGNNSFYLLEKLGQVIGERILLELPLVSAVRITLKKTAVWNDAVPGVTIFLNRP